MNCLSPPFAGLLIVCRRSRITEGEVYANKMTELKQAKFRQSITEAFLAFDSGRARW
jgi:hypothetical protein